MRMFSANLVAINDKLSYYVMHIHIAIDSNIFTKEFDVDSILLKLITRSFPNYKKELAIELMFPHQAL